MFSRFFLAWMIGLSAHSPLPGDTQAQNHLIKPEQLFALLDRADQVVVYETRLGSTPQAVFSSSEPKDVLELKAAMTIETPEEWFRCACIPSIEVRLLRKNENLGSFSVSGGLIIGFHAWDSDARIQDREKWLKWFDARGITVPRQEVEREEAAEKAYRADLQRWETAMPASLQPLWPKVMEDMVPWKTPDLKDLDSALGKQFPEVPKRIRALMAWFGSGAGPWSGFPMYETVAEEMLLEYETSELLAAVQGVALSKQETEGAARLLAGWDFNHRRPGDNILIPKELKRLLLGHSLKSTDEDKLARARHAFQQE